MPAPRFVVTAVAGIVMATAVQVTATDLEHCMRVICENIRANALPLAAASSGAIIAEEQEHHDCSAARLGAPKLLERIIDRAIASATRAVIWLGMRL